MNQLDSFVEYVVAIAVLKRRLAATPAELAGWVALGPKCGGLAAYTNANELNPPPEFHFSDCGSEDYELAIMSCWFRMEDLETFDPPERYLTGQALCERWADRVGGAAPARQQIRVLIQQSRLLDSHPITGLSRESADDPGFPPLECALFALSEVERVEHSWDAGSRAVAGQASCPAKGSPEWRKQNAKHAVNAKHARTAARRSEQQKQILAAWDSGRYTSRDRCAEEECGALGMSFSTARKILRNTPEPKNRA